MLILALSTNYTAYSAQGCSLKIAIGQQFANTINPSQAYSRELCRIFVVF